MDFAGEADFLGHGFGTTAEFGGGEDVAGLVDERAGEVLAFGEDDALVEAVLHFGGGFLAGFAVEDGGVDGEVLAVGPVEVDVEVGEDGAFGEGAGGEFAGKTVEVLVGEGGVFGEGDGEVAEVAGAGVADGYAGTFAELVRGERGGFAEADDEETLGFEVGRGVEQEGFAEGGFELAGGQPGGGGVGEGVESGEEGRGCGGVFAGGYVDGEDGEERGGEVGGGLEEELGIHHT